MVKIKVPNGRGFDVIVWQKRVEDAPLAAAYTLLGKMHMAKFLPKVAYRKAYSLDDVDTDLFFKDTAGKLLIGGISGGARVPVLVNPHLH